MRFRAIAFRVVAGVGTILSFAQRAGAQEHPVQRIANIVSVAVSEYAKGVDDHGRVIAVDEYKETLGFLADARLVADRLPSQRSATLALLDTLISAVTAKRPPLEVASLEKRFAVSL